MAGALATLARGWRAVLAAMLLAAIVALLIVNAAGRRERDRLAGDLAAAWSQHNETVTAYQLAAQVAQRREAETVARVAADQRAITERVTHDFQVRLVDSDARYQRLREQAAAHSGRVVDPDMSAAGEAACRAYANAACDELPGLLKAAQDNTDQLVALIAWATAQGDVDVMEAGE